jgi:hypothetical protein
LQYSGKREISNGCGKELEAGREDGMNQFFEMSQMGRK